MKTYERVSSYFGWALGGTMIDDEDADLRSSLAALGPAALRDLDDVLSWSPR